MNKIPSSKNSYSSYAVNSKENRRNFPFYSFFLIFSVGTYVPTSNLIHVSHEQIGIELFAVSIYIMCVFAILIPRN